MSSNNGWHPCGEYLRNIPIIVIADNIFLYISISPCKWHPPAPHNTHKWRLYPPFTKVQPTHKVRRDPQPSQPSSSSVPSHVWREKKVLHYKTILFKCKFSPYIHFRAFRVKYIWRGKKNMRLYTIIRYMEDNSKFAIKDEHICWKLLDRENIPPAKITTFTLWDSFPLSPTWQ